MRIGDWKTLLPLELKRQLAEFERYVRLKLSELAASIATLNAANQNIGETIDDRVDQLLVAGANITLTYDDPNNTLTIAASGGGGGGLSDGDYGDVVVSGGGTVMSIDAGVIVDADINASAAIANSKMVSVAPSRLIGNPATGGGAAARSEIPVGGNALFDLGLYFNAGSLVAGTSFVDNTFQIRGNVDLTKILQFQVDGFTSGTTRTVYPPDADVDLRMSFAYIYEDFLARPVSTTASTNNTTIGQVTFLNAAVGTWQHIISSLSSEHPGLIRLGLPATANACSGIYTCPHLSRGGEWMWVCFRTATTFTNLTAKIGFFAGNTAVTTEPTDGVYLWQTAGTGTFGFKSAAASARTAGATAVLVVNTWYTLGIRMNDARTSCDFLLLDDAGATILSYAIATNLPSSSVVLYAQASVSTSAAAAVAQSLDIDLIRVRLGSVGDPLTRPVPPGEWSI